MIRLSLMMGCIAQLSAAAGAQVADPELYAAQTDAQSAAWGPLADAAQPPTGGEGADLAPDAISEAQRELLAGRGALREGRFAHAAAYARKVIELLRPVSGAPEVAELELLAEGVIARAERAASRAGHQVRAAKAGTRVLAQVTTNANAGAAGSPAQTSGAGVTAVQSPAGVGLAAQGSVTCGGCPVHAADCAEDRRLRAAGKTRAAVQAEEAARLDAVDASRLAGEDWVQYPADWSARVARRTAHQHGLLARGPSWSDGQGQTWNTSIYDLTDLTYVPPDFFADEALSLLQDQALAQYRFALAWRSEIVGGYCDDLAAGLPLLGFFGGVDPFMARGPKYSRFLEQQIVELIQAYLEPPGASTPGMSLVGP